MPLHFLKILDINQEMNGLKTREQFLKFAILLSYQKKELILEKGDITKTDFIPNNISQIISEKQSNKTSKSKKIKPKDRSLPTLEIDLHIHQLIKSTKGMDNFDMLTLQLNTAKRKIEYAISKRISKIVFIHGVGAGVLKSELHYLLGRYPVKFYDASYKRYGLGATEIYVYQNPKS